MIRVFAVDPSVFSDWSDFLSLKGSFGFSKARVIAKFPKKWRRLVYDSSVKLSTMQKKHLEIWLKEAEKFLVNSSVPYDGDTDWLTNAENAGLSDIRPFSSILSVRNPNNLSIVIVTNNGIIDNVERFNCPSHVLMPRTSDGYRRVCEPLLRFAEHTILIIDPYFNAEKRYIETIKTLLLCIKCNKKTTDDGINNICIKLFTTVKPDGSDRYKIDNMKEKFAKLTFNNCRLEILFIKEDKTKFHNRFILTDRCGINFPWGLDIREDSQPDIVNLMDETTYAVIFEQYNNINDSEILEKFSFN